jgi:hypothetical protein
MLHFFIPRWYLPLLVNFHKEAHSLYEVLCVSREKIEPNFLSLSQGKIATNKNFEKQ